MTPVFTLLLSFQILIAGEFELFKSKSIDQGKLTVLVFSGSDWCVPCIKYKKIFLDHESFKELKENQISIYIADFPRKKKNKPSKEKQAENEILASKFNLDGKFPYTIVFDRKGNIVKKWEGIPFKSVADMKNLLSSF
jgi:thioredoxin-related protein